MIEDLSGRSAGAGGQQLQEDLRQQLVAVLLDRSDEIAADTAAIFPHGAEEAWDSRQCRRMGRLLVQLLAFAARDGRVDARGSFVADFHQLVRQHAVSADRLFTLAYLIERTALDELATDETIGATTEAWPLAAQLVRRASFDVLAAYHERVLLEPVESTMIDRLTTLHTRSLFQTVLAKEAERAGRFGLPLSVILFDVDNLARINGEHGYGVGDRILERLGILIRGFFRQHDWIARYFEDSIVVLLANNDAAHASDLAENVRATVAERLESVDHRSDRKVRVTLSAAVVNVRVAAGGVVDPARLMADAEAAVARAKRLGRNRIERIDDYPGTLSAEPT